MQPVLRLFPLCLLLPSSRTRRYAGGRHPFSGGIALHARVAVVLTALFSSNLLAAEPPRDVRPLGVLAVDEGRAPSLELAELTGALRRSVARLGHNVLGEEELRARMQSTPPAAAPRDLDARYAAAIAAANGGDHETAISGLAALADVLETLPPSNATFGRWTHTLLRLARAQATLGRREQGAETLKRLLRADPTASADIDVYPPSFVRQLDEARNALEALPRRVLTVHGPKGARVFVAGREVGLAPATLAVVPGRYRVGGVLGEARVTGGEWDLTTHDVSVTLHFTLSRAFRPADGPGLILTPGDAAPQVVFAGASMNLGHVVAASVASAVGARFLVATLYDVRRGAMVSQTRAQLTGAPLSDAALDALAARLFEGQAPADCDPTSRPEWAQASAREKKQLIEECARRTKMSGPSTRPAP